jgi:tetratricopeptide (TPR) repeat protein
MKPQALRQLKSILFLALGSMTFMMYIQNRNTKAQIAKVEKEVSQKLYDQALQFPGRPASPVASPSPAVSPVPTENAMLEACNAFNEKIETLPLETLLFDLRERNLQIPPQCIQDKLTNPMFEAMNAACQPEAQTLNPTDCATRMFQYRARRIQLWSNSQDMKSLSTEVLVQKFYGLLSSGEMNQEGGAQLLRSIAEELKTRLPQSSAPNRIEVISYLIDPPKTEEQSQAAAEALRVAREKSPDDWQLFEVDLIQKSPEDYEQTVRAFASQYPDSPIALYHLGCIAWKKGVQSEALQYFQRASQLAPTEARFSTTADKAKTEAPGTSICSAQMNFDSRDF